MQVWRICPAKYAAEPFSGIGGLKVDGRWHRTGTRIVYTSRSLEFAVLESFVHLPPTPLIDFVWVSATIPDSLAVPHVEMDRLPQDWNRYPDPPSLPYVTELQQLGTEWANARSSVALGVPSAIVPTAWNYLLNPLHPDFAFLSFEKPQPFQFDPRLWK